MLISLDCLPPDGRQFLQSAEGKEKVGLEDGMRGVYGEGVMEKEGRWDVAMGFEWCDKMGVVFISVPIQVTRVSTCAVRSLNRLVS